MHACMRACMGLPCYAGTRPACAPWRAAPLASSRKADHTMHAYRCGFWENLRYKNVERQPWVAPCNLREVRRLVQDLKERGMDLDAFQPADLFNTIRGRTLWCGAGTGASCLRERLAHGMHGVAARAQTEGPWTAACSPRLPRGHEQHVYV